MTPELETAPGKPSLMTPDELITDLREVETRVKRYKRMRETRYNALISWCMAQREAHKISLKELGRAVKIPYSKMLNVFYSGNVTLTPDDWGNIVACLRRKIARKQLALQPSED